MEADGGSIAHVKKQTSHLLHFFLGLFTLGLWWIVWFAVGIRASYDQRLAVETAARMDSERRGNVGRLG